MSTIKVGYLVSYDYEFLKNSLPCVYNYADEIFLAVDQERKTWSGESFLIQPDFWEWIEKFDSMKKITIYEDRFYVPTLSPMECDTRERNMLAKRMGDCDWYVQIDSDEYFIDFSSFAEKLRRYSTKDFTTVACRVATLFKRLSNGYLVITESTETLNFATNNPIYNAARNNTTGNRYIYWNDLVLHQSWARTPEDIYMKLNNWSHKDDFNVQSFFKLWSAVDESNFYALRDFHPLTPTLWPKLKYIEGNLSDILTKENKFKDSDLNSIKKKSMFSRIWREIKR